MTSSSAAGATLTSLKPSPHRGPDLAALNRPRTLLAVIKTLFGSAVVTLLSVGGLACGSQSVPTGPSTPQQPSSPGYVNAVLDGQPYRGVVVSARAGTGFFPWQIHAVDANGVGISLQIEPRLGTTQTGATPTLMSVVDGTTGTWAAGALGGRGTVTVSTITSGSISGTFEFVAVRVPLFPGGGPETRTVIEGTFDVRL